MGQTEGTSTYAAFCFIWEQLTQDLEGLEAVRDKKYSYVTIMRQVGTRVLLKFQQEKALFK